MSLRRHEGKLILNLGPEFLDEAMDSSRRKLEPLRHWQDLVRYREKRESRFPRSYLRQQQQWFLEHLHEHSWFAGPCFSTRAQASAAAST